MYIFFIAILVSLIVRWISKFTVSAYVDSGKTDEQMGKSFIFNLAVASYIIGTVLMIVSGLILCAHGVKTLFL